MCMCIVSRCRDFHTGKGCFNCEVSVKIGIKPSFDPMSGAVECNVCNCNCKAYFLRSNWSKLKAQQDVDSAQKAIEKKESIMKQAAGKLKVNNFSLCVILFIQSHTIVVNTPDIRAIWQQIASTTDDNVSSEFMDLKPSAAAATATPSTTTTTHNMFSDLSNKLASSEKLQMDMAFRNSMKGHFMSDREDINTKRHLFLESDKKILPVAKRPARASEIHYDFSNDVSSPEASPDLVLKKQASATKSSASASQGMKRSYNNELDHRYVMSTQFHSQSPTRLQEISTPNLLPSAHWSKIRFECIRCMRLKNENSPKAVMLFRILNRKEPKDMWSDISTLASDCHHNGDTIEDTIECMLSML